MTEIHDIETLAGAGLTVTAGGREIAVTPVKVREIPAFMDALEPTLADLGAGLSLPDILARHAEAMIRATAIGARVDRAWLDDLEADDLIELAVAVLEVNADFFVRRMLPRITAASERLAKRLAGSGSTPDSEARA